MPGTWRSSDIRLYRREPALEAAVDGDPLVRAADARLRLVAERVVRGEAPVSEYGEWVMRWLWTRHEARQRLLRLSDGMLDEILEESFPASDPMPAAALTPAEGVASVF
ncbi:MAG TPA: hypothetical protein VGQ42_10615 [Candidatus Dormibacteraeota bacterium]|jgi:hypothetical protein|nr:hypothetical protein [Candidatus Dormibacteraeota bacterium]